MTDEEIAALLRGPESDRVERKEAPSDRVRRAICGFANDLASHRRAALVLVGQRDDGTRAGLAIDDALLSALAGIRVESAFAPFPSIDVRRLALDGGDVAAIIVHPSSSPPVRYDGRIWVRVGPTTRIATPEEERRLSERRRAAHLPFDVQPVAGAGLGELDLERFRRDYLPNAIAPDILEQNHRALDAQLAALRMLTSDGEATVVGVLTLANDPTRFLPGAYVQFVRFDGTSLADPIVAQARVAGPLHQVLGRLDDLIDANIRTELVMGGRPTHAARPEAQLVPRSDRGVEPRRTVRPGHDRAVRRARPHRLSQPARRGGPQGARVRRAVRRRAVDRESPARGQRQSRARVRGRAQLRARAASSRWRVIPTLGLFNRQGGVGTTSLAYHLAWIYADLGYRVLAVDLDPQASLSAALIEDARLEELWAPQRAATLSAALAPLVAGAEAIPPHRERIAANLELLVGDLSIVNLDEPLVTLWERCLDARDDAFRGSLALHRCFQRAADDANADLVLVDLGPNQGPVHRAALLGCQHVLVPMTPNLFAIEGLRALGPVVGQWAREWKERLPRNRVRGLVAADGALTLSGYVVLQDAAQLRHPPRLDWMSVIPDVYATAVGASDPPAEPSVDPRCLGVLPRYPSLTSLAVEARKPIFHLRPADGALGAHATAARQARKDFEVLAKRIAVSTWRAE